MKCYAIDKIIVSPLLLKSNQNQTLEVRLQVKFCKPVSDIRPQSPAQMYGKFPACGSSLVPDKCSTHLCSGKTE